MHYQAGLVVVPGREQMAAMARTWRRANHTAVLVVVAAGRVMRPEQLQAVTVGTVVYTGPVAAVVVVPETALILALVETVDRESSLSRATRGSRRVVELAGREW